MPFDGRDFANVCSVHSSTAADDAEPQSSEACTAEEADTAVFYSISSTQKGLAGIDLGNFLIKQVTANHDRCCMQSWKAKPVHLICATLSSSR